MTTAHTTTTPAAADQTTSRSTTSADRRHDRQQAHERYPWWRTVLSWAGFGAGCALLVLCAFMVKNSAQWNRHLGGPIWSFLILFTLMLIAGLLIMGGITKAIDWTKHRLGAVEPGPADR